MKLSILPVFIVIVFGFAVFITRRAAKRQSITKTGALSIYALLSSLGVWTLIAVLLGIGQTHLELMEAIPLLWQACVAVVIVTAALLVSSELRGALRELAASTPGHWLAFFQALRIGALGGVLKGFRGEITSDFVFWVGIPDMLFGASALIVGWLVYKQAAGRLFLIAWNLIGLSVILLPTFLAMNYWMNEPGFSFIFEFPMVMAPSIVVPMFILLNSLQAWGAWESGTAGELGAT